ncbi:hypothetical protein GGR50DRAFT_690523 [Xylaria sp. CBS 124048]|nr:hypothetical protein GGR50DRAFT_690523 [Xylaria sp. CBS 124048]
MNGPVSITSIKTNKNHPASIDEDILDGPPSTTWHDFKHAKLRQFPRHATRIKWLEYLGHGSQGIVFKATIGNGDPVAIKIFWRTLRPDPYRIPLPRGGFRPIEWLFEEESRTVALLEKIKWVMSTETNPEQSVKVEKGPKRYNSALRNLYSFSDEGRRSSRMSTRRELTDAPPFPPLPTCYGWMKVKRSRVPQLYPPLRREMDYNLNWHWALVYELVPGATQDLAIGQLHLDFFHAVGFDMHPYKPDNWHGGRLVDYTDICSPLNTCWSAGKVRQREAKEWFWTLDFSSDNITRRTIMPPPT